MADSGPTISVTKVNTVAQEGKQKLKPLRHSNYKITINGNVATHSPEDDQVEAEKLYNLLTDIFEKDILSYITVNTPGDSIKQIKDIKIDFATEKGPNHEKVHAHMGVFISHRTNVSLNYQKIRAAIRERLPKAYVHNHLMSRSAQDSLISYIHKEEKGQ